MLTPANTSARGVDSNTGVITGNVRIVDRNDRELADRSNVVIFIDGVSGGSVQPHSSEPPTITHAGMRFMPRVVPIVKGQMVDFLNDDAIFHNVFSLSTANVFDLGIYPEGTTKLLRFDTPGLVKIYCNIHPNMIGNVLVLNNALFAVTDHEGNFEISNVPEGKFSLRVWHEFADQVSREITVAGGVPLSESFDLKETRIIKRHKNKFGKSYRKKY